VKRIVGGVGCEGVARGKSRSSIVEEVIESRGEIEVDFEQGYIRVLMSGRDSIGQKSRKCNPMF
jgi:hypothetical protein